MKNEMFSRLFVASMLFVSLNLFLSCETDSTEINVEAIVPSKVKSTVTARGGNVAGEVTGSTGAYVAKVNGVTKYTGADYIAAIQAAINNLTASRDVKEWVTVRVSGTSGASGGALKYVYMASYTGLDFASNTFNANSGDALIIPIWADRKTNIEVKNLKMTGKPRYGIWF